MTASELRSDLESAGFAAQSYAQGLDTYCSFSLKPISVTAPVSGSTVHDNLGSEISSALEQWSVLVESDSQAILTIANELDEADASLAQKFLGVGDAHDHP